MTASASLGPVIRACTAIGVEVDNPELLRDGENTVWRVRPGVIARLSRSGDRYRIETELQIARWLADNDFPAVQPLAGIPQPVMAEGTPVTFWKDVGAFQPGDVVDVGHLLHRLHDLPQPTTFDPGRLDTFIRIEPRIAASVILDGADQDWLLRRLRDLRDAWSEKPAGMAERLLHGDAWVGNIARLPSGATMLMDLERAGNGPPEWDLVSTAIKLHSFAWISPAEYTAFCTAYGTDVYEWAGYELFRDIRELRMATYALQRAEREPRLVAEARLRLRCLRGDEGPRPWAWRSTG